MIPFIGFTQVQSVVWSVILKQKQTINCFHQMGCISEVWYMERGHGEL